MVNNFKHLVFLHIKGDVGYMYISMRPQPNIIKQILEGLS